MHWPNVSNDTEGHQEHPHDEADELELVLIEVQCVCNLLRWYSPCSLRESMRLLLPGKNAARRLPKSLNA